MRLWFINILVCAGAVLPAGIVAAQSDPFMEEELPEDEIVTTGERQALSEVAKIVPDMSFAASDVLALGAADINEVIDAINAEIGDQSSGPPIILLDGRPVKSRREVRRFPSEAIRRVDVLPPEAALKYSASPDRRVLNFVLRRRFNSVVADLRGQTTTDGGRESGRGGTNYLRIRNKTRLAISLDLDASKALSEDERDISARARSGPYAVGGNITADNVGDEIDPFFSALAGDEVTIIGLTDDSAASGNLDLSDFLSGANVANMTDERFFRDLEPRTKSVNFGTSFFRPAGERLSIKAALNADFASSRSRRGLSRTRLDIPSSNPFSPFNEDIRLYSSDDLLLRKKDESDIDGSLSIFADYPTWRWALDAEYDVAEENRDTSQRVETDALQSQIDMNAPEINPFEARPQAVVAASESTQKTAVLKGRVSGVVADLPAGPVNASAGAEIANTSLSAFSTFGSGPSETKLSRSTAQIRADLDIPLAGQSEGDRRAAGRLSARLSGSAQDIEDVGTLTSYGAGLNWNAALWLRLQGSFDVRERPPTLLELGSPNYIDTNVSVADFLTGESVFVDRLKGGNALLEPERRQDLRLTATFRKSRDLQFSTRYRSQRIDNDTRSFPFLTPQIFEAFPDRFIRDSSGQLIEFDARPVNAFLTSRESLRSGFNITKRFRQAAPAEAGSRTREGRRRRGGSPDRVSLSFYHTLRLTDDIQFRENGPILDLLDGAGLSVRGGQPVHEIETRLNMRRKNYGGGLFLTHESGKTLETAADTGLQNIEEIRFKPLTQANLRFYYDLGRKPDGSRVPRGSWRSNLRLTLDVNNIGNQRQDVETESGAIPIAYEADKLNPEGRAIRLTLRKMFSKRRARR